MLVACLAAASARAEGITVAGYGALPCARAVAALDGASERHAIVSGTLGSMSGTNAAQTVHAGVYRDLANLNGESVDRLPAGADGSIAFIKALGGVAERLGAKRIAA